jgi:hypothetical protein
MCLSSTSVVSFPLFLFISPPIRFSKKSNQINLTQAPMQLSKDKKKNWHGFYHLLHSDQPGLYIYSPFQYRVKIILRLNWSINPMDSLGAMKGGAHGRGALMVHTVYCVLYCVLICVLFLFYLSFLLSCFLACSRYVHQLGFYVLDTYTTKTKMDKG